MFPNQGSQLLFYAFAAVRQYNYENKQKPEEYNCHEWPAKGWLVYENFVNHPESNNANQNSGKQQQFLKQIRFLKLLVH